MNAPQPHLITTLISRHVTHCGISLSGSQLGPLSRWWSTARLWETCACHKGCHITLMRGTQDWVVEVPSELVPFLIQEIYFSKQSLSIWTTVSVDQESHLVVKKWRWRRQYWNILVTKKTGVLIFFFFVLCTLKHVGQGVTIVILNILFTHLWDIWALKVCLCHLKKYVNKKVFNMFLLWYSGVFSPLFLFLKWQEWGL